MRPHTDACQLVHASLIWDLDCVCTSRVLRLAGAFGTVYRALLDDVHEVAVKLMRPGHVDSRQMTSFCNEVSRAEHPRAEAAGDHAARDPCKQEMPWCLWAARVHECVICCSLHCSSEVDIKRSGPADGCHVIVLDCEHFC